MPPRTNIVPDSERDRQKTYNTIFSISPKLCTVVQDVESILKGGSHFNPMHTFSYRVQIADFWPPSKTNKQFAALQHPAGNEVMQILN